MPPKNNASPDPLILPIGVRFPRPEEFPEGQEAELARVTKANVTTGFRIQRPSGQPFSAYFDVNVHAPKLFALFHDLAFTVLPRAAAPILAIKDGETHSGRNTSRAAALRVFEPHIEALQQDGFLGFGLIAQQDGITEEVFVQPSKHLQVWTNQPDAARAVFAKHWIPEVPNLECMDQYPLVCESLRGPDGQATWPGVRDQILAAFATLPTP